MASRSASRSSGLVGVSTQISRVVGRDRRLDGRQVAQVDEAEVEPGRALAHLARTAGRCRHRGRRVATTWSPAVEQLQHGGDRRQARGEGEAVAAALQVGDAALEGEAGRVLACGSIRSPCARPGFPGRRSRWRRSAPSPRRWWDRAAGRRGWCAWRRPGGWPGLSAHRVCSLQVVDQVDAGDQAEELVAVQHDGHLVALEDRQQRVQRLVGLQRCSAWRSSPWRTGR